MNAFSLLLQADWAERVGWTLLHSLWQIALLAAAYALVSVSLKNRSATVRYCAGCVTLFAMLGLPLSTYFLQSQDTAQVSTDIDDTPAVAELSADSHTPTNIVTQSENLVADPLPPVAPSNSAEPEIAPVSPAAVPAGSFTDRLLSALRPWLPLATVVWLMGAVLFSLRPLWGWLHVRRLQRHGLSPLSDQLRHLGDSLAVRLGVKRAVQFLQSSLVEVPTVVGCLRPMILLPASAITGLTVKQIELILAHELAHVRRHDYLVNLAQTMIEALLFFHPGMWWVSTQIRQERENCCDDIAVALGEKRAVYVQALARLEQQRQETPTAVLAATGGSLLARIRRLLVQPKAEFGYLSTAACFAGLATLSVVALVAGFAIATGGTEPSELDLDNPPPLYEKNIRVADDRHAIKVGKLRFHLSDFNRTDDGALEAGLGLSKGYEVVSFRLFDHKERRFIHSSTLHSSDEKPKFNVRRMGKTGHIRIKDPRGTLPPKVDVWLRVVENRRGETLVIPAREAASAKLNRSEIIVGKLLRGSMSGKSSPSGRMIWDTKTVNNETWQTTVNLENRGANLRGRFHLVAVDKDGTRYAMDHKHFLDFTHSGRHQYIILDVALDAIDHLELVPFKTRHKFFFNGVHVPTKVVDGSAADNSETTSAFDEPVSSNTNENDTSLADRPELSDTAKKILGTWHWSSFLAYGTQTFLPDGTYRYEFDERVAPEEKPTTGKWRVENETELVYETAPSDGEDFKTTRYQIVSISKNELKLKRLSPKRQDNIITYTRTAPKWKSDFGVSSSGVRCRLVAVSPTTESPDITKVASEFARGDDLTFVVELKNFNKKPLTLLGVNQNTSFFAPRLFEFEFTDAKGKPIPRTERMFERPMIVMDREALTHEVAPGESLTILLRPAQFMAPLQYTLPPGRFEVKVRYRGPTRAAVAQFKKRWPDSPQAKAWPHAVTSNVVEFSIAADPAAAKPPKLVWGPIKDGLQAAIEIRVPKNVVGVPTKAPGVPLKTKLGVVYHVKNVGNKPITFVSEAQRQGDELHVTNAAGEEVKVRGAIYTDYSIDVRWKLKPGEIARLHLLDSAVRSIREPGQYTVRYTIHFNSRQMKDAEGNIVFPRPGDWQSELETGATPLFLRARTAAGQTTSAFDEPVSPNTNEKDARLAERPNLSDTAKKLVGTWDWSSFVEYGTLTFLPNGSYRYENLAPKEKYFAPQERPITGKWRIENETELVYETPQADAATVKTTHWQIVSIGEKELKLKLLSPKGKNKIVTYTLTAASDSDLKQGSAEHRSIPYRNAALSYWQAFALMPRIDAGLRRSLGEAVSAKRPIDSGLRKLVDSSENALRYLHRGTRFKQCTWGLAYENGPFAMLPHLTKVRDLARIALLRARLRFEADETTGAMDDIVAAMTMGRHAGQEGVIILSSILVDYTIEFQAIQTIAEFLPKLNGTQRQSLEQSFRELPVQGGMQKAVAGEKQLFMTWLIREIKTAKAKQRTVEFGGEGDSDLKKRVASATTNQLLQWANEMKSVYEEGAKYVALSTEQAAAKEEELMERLTDKDSGNPLGAMFLPSFGAARRAEARYLTQLALLQAAFAILKNGKGVISQPEFRDPFGDGPFEYRKTKSGFQLVGAHVHNNAPVTLSIGGADE